LATGGGILLRAGPRGQCRIALGQALGLNLAAGRLGDGAQLLHQRGEAVEVDLLRGVADGVGRGCTRTQARRRAAAAPGKARGVRCNRVVELVDLYPTLAEMAGLPPEPGVQGQSLVPLLQNPKASRDKNDAWIFTGRGHGLRTERWAFMWYPAKRNRQEAFMLYDMKSDPGQFTNLAANPNYAGLRSRLHRHLRERVASVK